jgi:hypothetical protein
MLLSYSLSKVPRRSRLAEVDALFVMLAGDAAGDIFSLVMSRSARVAGRSASRYLGTSDEVNEA